ncbi:GTP-binding protein [Legionella dresdenensis]|uniref:GTP-binding protein n=1 Tax=Legionella dresdenensis TaxID=450200 RepID=A0ABV8CHH7_9GAMM
MRNKILIIGDLGAGKTQLSNRFTEQPFSPTYYGTIAADYNQFQLNNRIFQLVDKSGDKRYQSLLAYIEQDASLFLYCIDASQPDLAARLPGYKAAIAEKQKHLPKAKMLLIATKRDEESSGKNIALLTRFAKENNYSCIETSAKANTGIDKLKQEIQRVFNCEENALKKAKLLAIVTTLIRNIEIGKNRKTTGMGSDKVAELKKALAAIEQTTDGSFNEQDTIVKIRGICIQRRNSWDFFRTPHSVKEFENLLLAEAPVGGM